jgi:hypothetical protein
MIRGGIISFNLILGSGGRLGPIEDLSVKMRAYYHPVGLELLAGANHPP